MTILAVTQYDWIEQLAEVNPDDLAAVDASLAYFPDCSAGRLADIRASLLKHQAALLGHLHQGAAIPTDVRFKDGFTNIELLGTNGPFHAWAISDLLMEMAGGHGATPAQARADAMVGLMLNINETVVTRRAA